VASGRLPGIPLVATRPDDACQNPTARPLPEEAPGSAVLTTAVGLFAKVPPSEYFATPIVLYCVLSGADLQRKYSKVD
jgi:hypothetical protein